MRQAESTTPSWQTILLLVAGVVIVVTIALLLAQIDSYQRRSEVPSNGLPVIDLDATVAAGELSTVYLPSEVSPTPTPFTTPAQATPVVEEIPPATSVTMIESTCDIPHNWAQYDIRAGDTLPKLARAHKMSVYHLMQANCLETTDLTVGQKLFVPAFPPALAKPSEDSPHPPPWSDPSDQPATPPWPIATPTSPPSR